MFAGDLPPVSGKWSEESVVPCLLTGRFSITNRADPTSVTATQPAQIPTQPPFTTLV